MRRIWACFMFLIWTQSLEDRRRALWKAETLLESSHAGFTGTVADDKAYWTQRVLRAEAKVNRALVKRNKWKKRACENCRTRVQRLGS